MNFASRFLVHSFTESSTEIMLRTEETLVSLAGTCDIAGHTAGINGWFIMDRVHPKSLCTVMAALMSTFDCCILSLHRVSGVVDATVRDGGNEDVESLRKDLQGADTTIKVRRQWY